MVLPRTKDRPMISFDTAPDLGEFVTTSAEFELEMLELRDELESRELERPQLFGSENLLLGEELETDSSVDLETILEGVSS